MNYRASLWNTSDKLLKSASCKFLPQSGNPVIFKTLFLQKGNYRVYVKNKKR